MLLAPPPQTELPVEALLARLRARRATLEQQVAVTGSPTPDSLLTWLHPRLAAQPRRALRPPHS